METPLHNFYGPDLGKKGAEWDLNEWKWDGDLFTAAPLNSASSDCRGRQLVPDEVQMESRDLEKRGRDEEAAGSLNLKLGGGELQQEGQIGKKTKVAGALLSSSSSGRAVCQVDDCKSDLSNAKDYHRRHKVCDLHSKSTSALVRNVMQRFCQQCSRFHYLQEFDEGKRSCRRRLAGHNKRRRKTHPENNSAAVATPNDDLQGGSNYLLISLLRVLSNIHSNISSDQWKDQDLLSHLLSNLANLAGITNQRNGSVSQGFQNAGTALKGLTTPVGPVPTVLSTSALTDKALPGGVSQNASISQPASQFHANGSSSIKEHTSDDVTVGRTQLNNIDLNDVYDGSKDEQENTFFAPENLGTGPLWLYQESQRSNPPKVSGNSGSTSSQSPSTSSGEAQSRTDRIVFKLFGKDPSDFPLGLRKQILDWLSNSPTDIESYIRPGCIILTIYLRMDKSSWDGLYCDLESSLRRLLNTYTDSFWRTGWIYTRVQHRVTFMYNGQVVLHAPLPMEHQRNCRISSIKPIAVTVSENVQFSVKGFNLSPSTSRLLCTLEGNYPVHGNCSDSLFVERDGIQCFSFSCVVPNIVGRGFIEVEDHGLSSSFFPFIVAEKAVCSEICSLERVFDEVTEELEEVRNQALEFIHEMGWLLHRSRLKCKLGEENSSGGAGLELFSFERFKWLVEFSIDHDWCAVVKKLLNILFIDGTVDLGQESLNLVRQLLDIGLVHRAVRRNCSSTVELLLNYYIPTSGGALEKLVDYYLFRPDAVGPGGLTPLHIAACLDSCDDVVDALTEDPQSVGIKAWRSARDSSGLTAHDYACLRGHYLYNDLVEKKLNKKQGDGHIVVDINRGAGNSKFGAFECEVRKMAAGGGYSCEQCKVKILSYGAYCSRASVRLYRPAMVSMVAIAAVCVCTALLFKSIPLRWEVLKYGSQ